VTSSRCRRSVAAMGTIVTIQAVGHAGDSRQIGERDEAVERAVEWFHRIEEHCSRFDPASELSALTSQVGAAVPASAILYEAVAFALAVAEESGGAFDPTVGHRMEARGFNREHRTGRIVRTGIDPEDAVSYRDVRMDPDARTITLLRPLLLDLGGVAKGLAIDMAARELEPIGNFAVDAGGDLYLGGRNSEGLPWAVGIRHPRRDGELIDALRVSDRAVCTSGDYERVAPAGGGHHLIDPRTGQPAGSVASATVVARTAMLADALATAAFVLGPDEGLRLLERMGVDGLLVSPALERSATRGMASDYNLGMGTDAPRDGDPEVLPDAEGAADRPVDDPGGAGRARQRREPGRTRTLRRDRRGLAR
jgi:FAD:protein FMN transferase